MICVLTLSRAKYRLESDVSASQATNMPKNLVMSVHSLKASEQHNLSSSKPGELK